MLVRVFFNGSDEHGSTIWLWMNMDDKIAATKYRCLAATLWGVPDDTAISVPENRTNTIT